MVLRPNDATFVGRLDCFAHKQKNVTCISIPGVWHLHPRPSAPAVLHPGQGLEHEPGPSPLLKLPVHSLVVRPAHGGEVVQERVRLVDGAVLLSLQDGSIPTTTNDFVPPLLCVCV